MEPAADPAFAPSTPPRARCVLRIRLPPAWTSASLRRTVSAIGAASPGTCRAAPPGSAATGGATNSPATSTTAPSPPATTTSSPATTSASPAAAGRTSATVYGRTSRVMKRRWRELRKSDTLRKLWRPPLPAAHQEDVGMGADLDSPASSSQHPYTDLLASAVASCSLSCGTVGSGAGACTSLSLGFTCMAV